MKHAIPLAHSIGAAAILTIALASCGGPPVIAPPSSTVISAPAATGTPSAIPVVNRSVAAAEQALTLAMNTARAYTDLPRCDVSSARICSDREVVRQIRSYASQAHNALLAARRNEANVDLVSRMWVAIDALRAVIPAS